MGLTKEQHQLIADNNQSQLLVDYCAQNFEMGAGIVDESIANEFRNFAMLPTVVTEDYNKPGERRDGMVVSMIKFGTILVQSGIPLDKLLDLSQFSFEMFPEEICPESISEIQKLIRDGLEQSGRDGS